MKTEGKCCVPPVSRSLAWLSLLLLLAAPALASGEVGVRTNPTGWDWLTTPFSELTDAGEEFLASSDLGLDQNKRELHNSHDTFDQHNTKNRLSILQTATNRKHFNNNNWLDKEFGRENDSVFINNLKIGSICHPTVLKHDFRQKIICVTRKRLKAAKMRKNYKRRRVTRSSEYREYKLRKNSDSERTHELIERTGDSVERPHDPLRRIRKPLGKNHEPVERIREPVRRLREPMERTRYSVDRTRETLEKTREPLERIRAVETRRRDRADRRSDNLSEGSETLIRRRAILETTRKILARRHETLDKTQEIMDRRHETLGRTSEMLEGRQETLIRKAQELPEKGRNQRRREGLRKREEGDRSWLDRSEDEWRDKQRKAYHWDTTRRRGNREEDQQEDRSMTDRRTRLKGRRNRQIEWTREVDDSKDATSVELAAAAAATEAKKEVIESDSEDLEGQDSITAPIYVTIVQRNTEADYFLDKHHPYPLPDPSYIPHDPPIYHPHDPAYPPPGPSYLPSEPSYLPPHESYPPKHPPLPLYHPDDSAKYHHPLPEYPPHNTNYYHNSQNVHHHIEVDSKYYHPSEPHLPSYSKPSFYSDDIYTKSFHPPPPPPPLPLPKHDKKLDTLYGPPVYHPKDPHPVPAYPAHPPPPPPPPPHASYHPLPQYYHAYQTDEVHYHNPHYPHPHPHHDPYDRIDYYEPEHKVLPSPYPYPDTATPIQEVKHEYKKGSRSFEHSVSHLSKLHVDGDKLYNNAPPHGFIKAKHEVKVSHNDRLYLPPPPPTPSSLYHRYRDEPFPLPPPDVLVPRTRPPRYPSPDPYNDTPQPPPLPALEDMDPVIFDSLPDYDPATPESVRGELIPLPLPTLDDLLPCPYPPCYPSPDPYNDTPQPPPLPSFADVEPGSLDYFPFPDYNQIPPGRLVNIKYTPTIPPPDSTLSLKLTHNDSETTRPPTRPLPIPMLPPPSSTFTFNINYTSNVTTAPTVSTILLSSVLKSVPIQKYGNRSKSTPPRNIIRPVATTFSSPSSSPSPAPTTHITPTFAAEEEEEESPTPWSAPPTTTIRLPPTTGHPSAPLPAPPELIIETETPDPSTSSPAASQSPPVIPTTSKLQTSLLPTPTASVLPVEVITQSLDNSTDNTGVILLIDSMTSIDLDIPSRHQIPPEILASQTPMDPLRQINTLDSLKEILLIADSLTDVPKLLPDDTLPPPHIINTTTSLDLSYLQDPSLLPQTTRRTSKEKLQTVRVTSGEATTTSLLPSTKKSISSKDLFQLFYSDRKQVPADVTNVSPNAIQEGDREKLVHFLLHGKQVNDSNRQKDLTETKLRPTVITNQQITSQTFFHEHKGTDNRHSDQPPSMSVSEGELSPAFNPSERLTEDGPCGFQTPTTHTTESPTSSLKSGQNMYESSQNMHGSDQSMYGSGSTAPVTQKSRLYEPATDSQTTINAVTTLPENAATYRVEGRSISDTDGIVRIRRWPIPQRGAKNSFLAVRRRRGDNGHSRNRKMNLPAYFQL